MLKEGLRLVIYFSSALSSFCFFSNSNLIVISITSIKIDTFWNFFSLLYIYIGIEWSPLLSLFFLYLLVDLYLLMELTSFINEIEQPKPEQHKQQQSMTGSQNIGGGSASSIAASAPRITVDQTPLTPTSINNVGRTQVDLHNQQHSSVYEWSNSTVASTVSVIRNSRKYFSIFFVASTAVTKCNTQYSTSP